MAVTNSYICIFHVLFNSLLLLFFCYSNKLCCVYGEKTSPYHIIETAMLLHDSTCSASTSDPARRSQELQISHRYGPCSPLGQPKEYLSSREIFLKDEARVRIMNNNALILNSYHTDHLDSTEAVVVPSSTIPVGAGIFTASVGFGSQKRQFKLIFDTGSDVTWIKCTPSSKTTTTSRKQKQLIFDPSKSFSYSKGSCIAGSVVTPPKIKYVDGSYSYVRYGCDTLFLPPSDVIPKFQFGCGEHNTDDFGDAAGMLGLGQGQLSITSQASSSKLGKTFRYCLPPVKSSSGHLLFGKRAKAITAAASSPLKFTPLIKHSGSSYYYITLIGISVANERLNISPSVFASSPGTVIDSGTVITRLPISAYSALQSAFNKSMSSRYPPAPPLPPLLDTCYNLEGYKNVEIPEIVLHFAQGADVRVHPLGIVWKEKNSLSQVCLAFAKITYKAPHDLTIIGNHQQLTLEVLYDLEGGRIGFGADGCS